MPATVTKLQLRGIIFSFILFILAATMLRADECIKTDPANVPTATTATTTTTTTTAGDSK